MYEDFYHMTHTPFSRNVPPEALYESRAMADCLGRLSYTDIESSQTAVNRCNIRRRSTDSYHKRL